MGRCEMKREKYLTFLLAICVFSYIMMINCSMTLGAESTHYILPQEPIIKSYIYDLRDSYVREQRLIKYIEDLTGLERIHCEFIVKESKEKNIDPFIVLGLIKRESDFNPHARGAYGEIGLGQLMESTAMIISENLGFDFYPDRLLDPEYNLKLTITQLSYLMRLYDNDFHMALTAYNRGQQGLLNYMKNENERGISDYSAKVLMFALEYKESFDNFYN